MMRPRTPCACICVSGRVRAADADTEYRGMYTDGAVVYIGRRGAAT